MVNCKTELLLDWIDFYTGCIKFTAESNGVFQRIKENNHDNREIQDSCLIILDENRKDIDYFMEQIDGYRRETKGLSRI
jgi:hypothetical protein